MCTLMRGNKPACNISRKISMKVHYEIIHILFVHAKYSLVVFIAYSYFCHRGQSTLLPRQKDAIRGPFNNKLFL